MKLSVSFSGFDTLSRRLALNAARRADALVRATPDRVVISEERAPHELGADAWPGPVPGIGSDVLPRGVRGAHL
jgi:hypothetical protein